MEERAKELRKLERIDSAVVYRDAWGEVYLHVDGMWYRRDRDRESPFFWGAEVLDEEPSCNQARERTTGEAHYKARVRTRIHPHTESATVECRDVMYALGLTRDYDLGEAFAHVWRCMRKYGDPLPDVENALRHLEFYVERKKEKGNRRDRILTILKETPLPFSAICEALEAEDHEQCSVVMTELEELVTAGKVTCYHPDGAIRLWYKTVEKPR